MHSHSGTVLCTVRGDTLQATLPRYAAEYLQQKMQHGRQQVTDFNSLRSFFSWNVVYVNVSDPNTKMYVVCFLSTSLLEREVCLCSCCKSLFTSDKDITRRKRSAAVTLHSATDIILCIAGHINSPFCINGLLPPILNPGCLLSVSHHRATPHAIMCLQLMFPSQTLMSSSMSGSGALLIHKERFTDALNDLNSVRAQDDDTMLWWIVSALRFSEAECVGMVLPRFPGAPASLDPSSACLHDLFCRSCGAFLIQFAFTPHRFTVGAATCILGTTS